MANPTTNFGWQMPTSTDLVTDLPADFEVFGQAVDTSLVDLKGGTTGQVLSKTSNTDMDFTWVTTDDANAIQNAIVDAKGDLIAASAADTPARLAVGTNGQVLTADSTTATGLAWATASSGSTNMAGKNGVLNSNFSVWQRGTSIAQTAAALYTADRWQGYQGTATAITYTRQTTSDTTNLPFIQYCARVQRNSGSTSTSQAQFAQSIESVNSIPYAGKTITMSFYARKGANYSMASDSLTLGFVTGTGTDQNVLTGFTGGSAAYTGFTLTGTWQRFTYTQTIPTTATQIGFAFYFTPTGTAGANDYFEVTGVQLEMAGSASAYSPNASTQQGELAACQRYLPAIYGGSYAGYAYATNSILYAIPFPVNARVAPTGITVTGTWTGYSLNSGSNFTPTFNLADKSSASIDSSGGRTITAGQGSRLESSGGVILFTGCEL